VANYMELAANPQRRRYHALVSKFCKCEFEENVIIQAFGLMRKVFKGIKGPLLPGDVFRAFITSFYIAFKFLIDETILFVKDLAQLGEMNEKDLEQLEKIFMVDILNFKLLLSEEEICDEKKILESLYEANQRLF
jgi:hypothetical protein